MKYGKVFARVDKNENAIRIASQEKRKTDFFRKRITCEIMTRATSKKELQGHSGFSHGGQKNSTLIMKIRTDSKLQRLAEQWRGKDVSKKQTKQFNTGKEKKAR